MSCWMSSSRLQTTFTGPSTCCGDLDGEDAAVGLEPSAEAAAEQMVVNLDRILRQAGDLGDHSLRQRSAPGCRPRCSQPSLRRWTVQFIGSIAAWARNGT